MKFRCYLLIIGLLATLVACKQQGPEDRGGYSPPIGEHMQMVHFNLSSLTDGTMLDSKQLEGQVLLVTFFAAWCPPCVQEIPTLIALQDSYKEKGFSVVAFSLDEGSPDLLHDFIKKHSINYPVVAADSDVTRGFGGVTGIPVTFLVNRKGEIVKKYLGYVGHEVLEEEIGKMIASE